MTYRPYKIMQDGQTRSYASLIAACRYAAGQDGQLEIHAHGQVFDVLCETGYESGEYYGHRVYPRTYTERVPPADWFVGETCSGHAHGTDEADVALDMLVYICAFLREAEK